MRIKEKKMNKGRHLELFDTIEERDGELADGFGWMEESNGNRVEASLVLGKVREELDELLVRRDRRAKVLVDRQHVLIRHILMNAQLANMPPDVCCLDGPRLAP